jgi:hypothetical protein
LKELKKELKASVVAKKPQRALERFVRKKPSTRKILIGMASRALSYLGNVVERQTIKKSLPTLSTGLKTLTKF